MTALVVVLVTACATCLWWRWWTAEIRRREQLKRLVLEREPGGPPDADAEFLKKANIIDWKKEAR